MNLAPLQAAIKLIADAVSDTLSPGAASVNKYTNLLPDLLTLIPQIGSVSLAGLSSADYTTLLTNLATDLALPAGKTVNVINASVKLLEDLVPDVQALIAAIKTTSPAAPAPAAAPSA